MFFVWDSKEGFRGRLEELFEVLFSDYYPNLDLVIKTHKWILKESTKDLFVLRHNKYIRDKFPELPKSPNKPRVYEKEGKVIIASDNEATACIYTLLLNKNIDFLKTDLKKNLQQNTIRCGIIREETPDRDKLLFNQLGIKGGMNNYSKKIANWGLKLCHIHDAAKCDEDDFSENIKFRMIISLSPLNIFPFPYWKNKKTKFKYTHTLRKNNEFIIENKELGEQAIIQEHFLYFLKKKYEAHSVEAGSIFEEYLKLIQIPNPKETLFQSLVEIKPQIDTAPSDNVITIKNAENNQHDEIDYSTPRVSYINGESCVAYRATRFMVSETCYQLLLSNPSSRWLIIRVNGGAAVKNHPEGYYKIPRVEAIGFIESKRSAHNWITNSNFHSVSIPTVLMKFFFSK